MGAAAILVSGCGGGSDGGEPIASGGSPPPAPLPTPAPPPVASVPTLRGVTIDQAEADILSGLQSGDTFFAAARTPDVDEIVTNAEEFQAAADRAFEPAGLARNTRIIVNWTGESAITSHAWRRVNIGKKQVATHQDRGGSLVVIAAQGQVPVFADTVHIAGRGILFNGITFGRHATAGEDANGLNAVTIMQSDEIAIESVVRFENCVFGAATPAAAGPSNTWPNGVLTSNVLADHLSFVGCTFCGLQNGVKTVARALRIENCDFQQCLKDGIALYGHEFRNDYEAFAVVTRSTLRNWGDEWVNRGVHADAIQTGSATDVHQGYRLLVTDTVIHMQKSYSGVGGAGGGTQGFFNAAHPGADNQFVLRRNIVLVTSPNGFRYFSPKASRPSFVDKSTFMRAGRTQSAFAPDTVSQDDAIFINGDEPAGGAWLLVTATIAGDTSPVPVATRAITSVDPRLTNRVETNLRPESLFAGQHFGRGNAAANGLAGKFGYDMPSEKLSQSRFVGDVWANFAPRAHVADAGAPDPRQLSWRA